MLNLLLTPREMMEVLRMVGGFGAQQKMKWCAPFLLMACNGQECFRGCPQQE